MGVTKNDIKERLVSTGRNMVGGNQPGAERATVAEC